MVMKPMDILQIITQDYQRFPLNQTYSIYAENVYFKDPLSEFRGLQRYQQMISFLKAFFRQIQLELHSLERCDNLIRTEWTLNMDAPLPWKPRLIIKGYSELSLNEQDQIISHIDYWYCSPWSVLKQVFKS